MAKIIGNLTLPSESGFVAETINIMERWGADAIRDSDGTKLPPEIKDLNKKIYTTYFVSRGNNDFARENMDECQQFYLMSSFNLATSEDLIIDISKGYFKEQVKIDYDHEPKEWWEVIDRTTGELVSKENWTFDANNDTVIINNPKAFHEYTVSFLAYAIWDPTQMYNHITNNWGDKEHEIPFDVRKEKSSKFVEDYLDKWLEENKDTDVVRFTTFFYHFTLVFNDKGKEKFVDWFGYTASVSTEAILAFEKEYGYRLRAEDFVDQGYYNSTFRVPKKEFLDFIEFQQKFVSQKAKLLVEKVHAKGKEAVMFLGDNWIGTEPYGKYFKDINLDGVVGSVNSGVTLRMISGIPNIRYSEARFLPYFFPDTFFEGNDVAIMKEAKDNWLSSRRALMRKPVDRIGYGGYLSLAYKFPEFVDYVEDMADEFRDIYFKIKGNKPYSCAKVAILNSWGTLRSWQTHMVAHALWYKQIYSYLGILESLSGMDVDVSFISFDDVIKNGVAKDIDVIINAGDAYTAFSGGEYWKNEDLVSKIRKWVYEGGGFIGIGEPTAYEQNGRYFQLASILGVDKELGFSLSTDKYFKKSMDEHFILEDKFEKFNFGESVKNIYSLGEETEILEIENDDIHLAASNYGSGRGVYIAGLPYSMENTRLLKRAILYSANKEKEINKYFVQDYRAEINVYPEIGTYAIVNNVDTEIKTKLFINDKAEDIILKPCEIRWGRL